MATPPKRRSLPKFGLRTLLLLVTLIAAGLVGRQKWIEYRRLENARQWVQGFDAARLYPVSPPDSIPSAEQIPTLQWGALHLESEYEKTTCLKFLAERYPTDCLEPLIQIARRSKDENIQRTAVHLISLIRDVPALSRLEPLAKSDDPLLRAARIDCIGFTHAPILRGDKDQMVGFLRNVMQSAPVACVKCDPPIRTEPLVRGQGTHFMAPATRSNWLEKRSDVPEHFRLELEKTMLADNSAPEERAAAARAIVGWPPKDYHLRYAEWGVWINSDGQFHLVDSVIDEIPDFVHRTGNNLISFMERLSIQQCVTKPVIHLSCNQRMAVDLNVSFNAGRPWFAYPRPDDFEINTSPDWAYTSTMKGLMQFDDEKIDELKSTQEGYPWITPAHRQHDNGSISGLGLRWQSVIVSPTKLPWMKLPKVDPDPKYAWWSELRDVPCSWVSNLNESERFLYYDGPTLAKSPIDIQYESNEIKIASQEIFDEPPPRHLLKTKPQKIPTDQRVCFYIRVTEDGASGGLLNLIDGSEVDLTKLKLDNAEQLKQQMLAALQQAGLNQEESAGLLKCWTPAFFETPGQRIVFLLHRSEYDLMCPMDIRPKPSETARVGLVLTELLELKQGPQEPKP